MQTEYPMDHCYVVMQPPQPCAAHPFLDALHDNRTELAWVICIMLICFTIIAIAREIVKRRHHDTEALVGELAEVRGVLKELGRGLSEEESDGR